MSRIFGPVRQNGYVVRDHRGGDGRTGAGWPGSGPWFYVERAPIHHFEYRGPARTRSTSRSPLANSGPLQLELVQQRNDVPSLYRDFLDAGQEGLQHIAYWTGTSTPTAPAPSRPGS